VFGLTFCHEWAQSQIAELFGIDDRTVRRRLARAFEAINTALSDRLPTE